MITQFGKLLVNIRMDRDITQIEMAQGLNISPAFLGQLERGVKHLPKTMLQRIFNYLYASPELEQKLRRAADNSALRHNIDVSSESQKTKEVVALFARTFDSLSHKDMDKIHKILASYDD